MLHGAFRGELKVYKYLQSSNHRGPCKIFISSPKIFFFHFNISLLRLSSLGQKYDDKKNQFSYLY